MGDRVLAESIALGKFGSNPTAFWCKLMQGVSPIENPFDCR